MARVYINQQGSQQTQNASVQSAPKGRVYLKNSVSSQPTTGGRVYLKDAKSQSQQVQPQVQTQQPQQSSGFDWKGTANEIAKGFVKPLVRIGMELPGVKPYMQLRGGSVDLPWLGKTDTYEKSINDARGLKQTLGAVAEPVVDIASMAIGGGAGKATLTGRQLLAQSLKTGAGIGGSYSAVQGLKQDKSLPEIGIETLKGATMGAGTAGILHGVLTGAGKAAGLIKSKPKTAQSIPAVTTVVPKTSKIETPIQIPKEDILYRGEGKIGPRVNAENNFGNGTYLTNKESYAAKYGDVKQYTLSKDAKVLKVGRATSPDGVDYLYDLENGMALDSGASKHFIEDPTTLSKYAKKNGYDAVKVIGEDGTHETVVLNNKKLQSPSPIQTGTERTLFVGRGSDTDKMINGVDELGKGIYVGTKETAEKFGKIKPITVRVKPEEVLQINNQKDFEKFTHDSIKAFPEMDLADAKTAFARSKGYKMIEAAESFDNLGGSSIIDESIISSQKSTPSLSAQAGNGSIQRGFVKNLAKDKTTPSSVYEGIPGYEKITNKQTLSRAAQEINADPQKAVNDVITGGINTDQLHNAKAQMLIRKLIEGGREDLAHSVATATSKNATEAARGVQIFAAYHKTTPDGALRNTYKMIDDFNAKNPTATVSLTPEKSNEITKLAEEVQKHTQGSREWQVAAALLEKAKAEITPVSKLGMLNKLQTMAQLLNPKTLIRNIGGNTALDVLEDVSRVQAAGIDKALHSLGFVKERNVVMPNLKTNWLNKLTGFKEGIQDVNMGIRTNGATGQYGIMQDAFAKGSILNKMEKLLGYELSTFDKAFYQGRYASSLENIMKAKGVKVPTPIMKDIADSEALYATFQNNSALANMLSKTKGGLNFGKEWGLGDLILKYPKTPGNIVSVGMDYSPIGFIKGLKQFHDSVKLLSPALQREAIINIGRGLTGSGLIMGGAMLAKKGILTADPEKDPDIRQLKRESGQGPFSINISALGRLFNGEDTKARNGDTISSYDWLQPNAIQLSMGANMILNKGDASSIINDSIESMSAGIDTATTQPVFSGVKRFIGNLDTSKGGGIGKAFGEAVVGAPASFAPSFLNQLGQYTDPTARSSYDPSMLKQSMNSIQAKIPFLREGLQPRVGVMGENQPTIQGGNNLFNVFMNPAFISKYNVTPQAQEVIDIYNRSGETKQTPRIAQKSVKIDGQNYDLTPQQYTQYQSYIGKRTDEEFSKLITDPYFQNLPDTEKANEMSTILSNVGKEGRDELARTGGLPPTIDMQAKQFLKDRNTAGFAKFLKEHPEINTKSDMTRLMNEVRKENYSIEQQRLAEEIAKIKRRATNQPYYTK